MNGKLKWYIMGAYLLMILLLMLSNCRGCNNTHREQAAAEEEVADSVAVVVVDDDSLVERASHIGQEGQIKVTAMWDFLGDVDLHVIEPSGEEIWFRNMKDIRTESELDVDNITGGTGSGENIYIKHPLSGRYKVDVVMYRINDAAPRGGEVTVVIQIGETSQSYRVNLTHSDQRETIKIFNYSPQ